MALRPVALKTAGGSNVHSAGDSSGRQIVAGGAASGAALAGNPVLIAGTDGTNARTLATDESGRQIIVGADAFQAGLTANPVAIGVKSTTNGSNLYALADTEGHIIVNTRLSQGLGVWQDAMCDTSGRAVVISGTAVGDSWETHYPFMQGVNVEGAGTVQVTLGDANGRQIMVGAAPSGSSVTGNPVLMAGSDGTNARTLATTTAGSLLVAPRATRIHKQRCTLDQSNGVTDSRLVGVLFYGVYSWDTVPFLTNSTASTFQVVCMTYPSYTHVFKVIGIDASNNEIEETLELDTSSVSVFSTNTFKAINDVQMITAMQPGINIKGQLSSAVEFMQVGANYQNNPYFMCPAGYVARLKGITGFSASANVTMFMQTYANNSTAILPGLYLKDVPAASTNITFPEPGGYELTAGQAALWVISGSASVTANFTAIWELIPN